MAGFSHASPTEFNDFRSQLNGLLATLQKLPVGEKQTALNLLKVTVKHQLEETEQGFSEHEKHIYQDESNHCSVQEELSQASESEFEHGGSASEGQEAGDEEDLCLNHQVPQAQLHHHNTHQKHPIGENVSFNILHDLSETDCLENTLTEAETKNCTKSSQKNFSSEDNQVSCEVRHNLLGGDVCSELKINVETKQSCRDQYCLKDDSICYRKMGRHLISVSSESQKNVLGKQTYNLHDELKADQGESQQHTCLESVGKYSEVIHVSEQNRLLGATHEATAAAPLLTENEHHITLITSREFCESNQETSEVGTVLHSRAHDKSLHALEDQHGHNPQDYCSGESLMHLRIMNGKQDRCEGKLGPCDKSNTFDENSCNSLSLSHFHHMGDRDNLYSEENSYLIPYLERENYDKIEYKVENITRKSNQENFDKSLEASYSSDDFLECNKKRETYRELDHDKTPVDLSSTSSSVQNVRIEGCVMGLEESPVDPHHPREAAFSSDPGGGWNQGKHRVKHADCKNNQKRIHYEIKRQKHIKNDKTLGQEKSVENTNNCGLILEGSAFVENLDMNRSSSNTVNVEEVASHVNSNENQCHSYETSLPGSIGSLNLDVEKDSGGCSNKQMTANIGDDLQDPKDTLSTSQENKEADVLSSHLRPVSCRICKEELPDMSLFSVHQRQCQGHLSCSICHAKFVHKVTYSRHMDGHKRNICSKCSQSFCSHKKLKAHMKTEHNFDLVSKSYPCNMCSRTFLKRSSLYYHLKVHAGENEHVCQTCGAFCKGDETFSLHMAEHQKATKFHCHICSASFKRRQQYDDHLKHHKKNRCEICGQPFTTKRALVHHCRVEHNTLPKNITLDREYKCDKCDRVFNRPSLLRHHLQLHRGVKLECRLCNKQFSHKRGLRKHMNSVVHEHTLLTNNLQKDHAYDIKQNYTFVCEYCGLKLPTRHMLSRHSRLTHKVGITWSCPHCDYTTKRNHTLKRHMELHLESRNFMCEICGSSFQALATLKDHYNFVHSDERNYKCSECNKSFKNKSSLARHSRTHSDDRPYQCHCGTSYKRLSHLKRHTSSAHKEIMKSRAVKKFKRPEEMDTNLDSHGSGQDQNNSKEASDGEEVEFAPVCNSSLSPVIQADASVKETSDILLPTQESIILMGENSNSEEGHLITVGDSQIIQLIPSTFQFPQENSFQTVSLVSAGDLHAIPLSTSSSYNSQGTHGGQVVVEPFSMSQSSEAMVMVPTSHHLGDTNPIPSTLQTLENEALVDSGRIGRDSGNHGIKQEISLSTLDRHTELSVSPGLDTYDYSGGGSSPQTSSLLPTLPPPHFITHAHSHNTSQDMLQPSMICSDFVLPVEVNR